MKLLFHLSIHTKHIQNLWRSWCKFSPKEKKSTRNPCPAPLRARTITQPLNHGWKKCGRVCHNSMERPENLRPTSRVWLRTWKDTHAAQTSRITKRVSYAHLSTPGPRDDTHTQRRRVFRTSCTPSHTIRPSRGVCSRTYFTQRRTDSRRMILPSFSRASKDRVIVAMRQR